MFVEGDKTRDESVPYFEGIQVKKVVMNEKLPIKDAVLNTAGLHFLRFLQKMISSQIISSWRMIPP